MARHFLESMRLLATLVAAVSTGAAAAAEVRVRELLEVGTAAIDAEFVRSDANGKLHFREAGGALRMLGLDQLVRWSAPASPRAADELHLVDGIQICLAAAWDGEPSVTLGKVRGEAKTNLLGRLEVDRANVRAIFWHLPPDDIRRLQITDRLLAASHDKSDVLLLENGDVMSGVLFGAGSSGNSLDDNDEASPTITFDGALGRIEPRLQQVRGVALSPATAVATAQPPRAKPKVLVGLRDGSLIAADSLVTDGEQLVITSAVAGQLRGADVSDVAFLQSLSAPIAFLSDREPVEYRHEPYLDLAWPFHRDRNVLGGPLAVDRQPYLKGVSMHSGSHLTYEVDGTYQRFAARIAIDDAAEGHGSAVFRVLLKHGAKWESAYASDIVRGGKPRDVVVELGDARALLLVVDYADGGDERDYANWLDARLE